MRAGSEPARTGRCAHVLAGHVGGGRGPVDQPGAALVCDAGATGGESQETESGGLRKFSRNARGWNPPGVRVRPALPGTGLRNGDTVQRVNVSGAAARIVE